MPLSDPQTPEAAYFLREESNDWGTWNCLIRRADDIEVATDSGEPEDATFTRDYAPVVSELNRLAARIDTLEAELALLRAVTEEHHRAVRTSMGSWPS